MSAALLRRGLELLAASEGEKGLSCDVGLCRRVDSAGGKGKRGHPTRSFAAFPYSSSSRPRPGQG